MQEKGEMLLMNGKERSKLFLVLQFLKGKIKQKEVAEILNLCVRQVRRLVKRVSEEGDKGVIHRSRGRESNRRVSDQIRKEVIALCRSRYKGFGPTLVSEKVSEEKGIQVSDETVRNWMKIEGIKYERRKGVKHRKKRERREHSGEMVQMDGSPHDWLEGRAPKMVLMACIDDATGNVVGRFHEYEGTLPAFDTLKRYCDQYGMPCCVYLDRHTTYKSNKKLSLEEELSGVEESLSQFQRAMKELGVELIHANSPQGKGRVERLFETLQDRLVKEMRLQEISTVNGANEFLETYWPKFNKRFGVNPAKEANFHRHISKTDLDRSLCIKESRRVRGDFTICYEGKFYQLLRPITARWVTVEKHLDGQIRISYKRGTLSYRSLPERPARKVELRFSPKRRRKPGSDHPWKRMGWLNRKSAYPNAAAGG